MTIENNDIIIKKMCRVTSCNNKIFTHGVCSKHDMMMRRNAAKKEQQKRLEEKERISKMSLQELHNAGLLFVCGGDKIQQEFGMLINKFN